MGNALARAPGSQSSPDLACHSAEGASKVSRAVYEQHGFLIGKSQGSIADGRSGGGGPRRHNSLSMKSMLMSKGSSVSGSSGAGSASGGRKKGKPSGQWRMRPESSVVFDPRTFLPVPRGGWSNHELSRSEWPEPVPC